MLMLDVHVIINPNTPMEWVDKCLESVSHAAECAGFPVATHVAPFIHGHIGQSRHEGYANGVHPYVTCVDDDDWLEPDAFACLREAMESGAPAIYTREFQHQNDHEREINLRQHLRVFRRDVVDGFDFEPWPSLDSTALIAHADTFGPAIELPNRVYHYRVRPDSGARKIKNARPELTRSGHKLGNVHEVASV